MDAALEELDNNFEPNSSENNGCTCTFFFFDDFMDELAVLRRRAGRAKATTGRGEGWRGRLRLALRWGNKGR